MNLYELKQPFENIYNVVKLDYTDISSEEIIDRLNFTTNDIDKNKLFSVLIHRSWQALVNIFYKQQNTTLTAEECYDIYLEALEYVITTKPWTNEDNSLYNDKNAFIKAVMQCSYSRKINYIISQHRHKRLLNCNAVSIDSLNEEFQDGYFTPYYDKYIDTSDGSVYHLIHNLFNSKQYLTAFILDAILTSNVYSDDNSLDDRRLRKHLRLLDEQYCEIFANTYKVNNEEVLHSLKYFQYLQTSKLSDKINQCLQTLRTNPIIKEAVTC